MNNEIMKTRQWEELAALQTEIDSAVSETRLFTLRLLQKLGHEPCFSFSLGSFGYPEVKSLLELHGYSVHRDAAEQSRVIAYRTESDRAPIANPKEATRKVFLST